MEEFLHTYGIKLAVLVLVIIFGKIGYEAGKLAVKYLSTTIKREIAEKSMQYVEQVYAKHYFWIFINSTSTAVLAQPERPK